LGWPSRIEDVADKLEESGLLTKTVRKTFIRTATENWEKFNGVQLGDDFIPPEYGGECEDG
jgi:sRNA-binding protein